MEELFRTCEDFVKDYYQKYKPNEKDIYDDNFINTIYEYFDKSFELSHQLKCFIKSVLFDSIKQKKQPETP